MLLFFSACEQKAEGKDGAAADDPKQECVFGDPQPMFSPSMGPVLNHSFEKNGQNATEEVTFSNGQEVTVLQSGCDTIVQEFRFFTTTFSEDPGKGFWLDQAVQQFYYLSAVDRKLEPFALWAVEINSKPDQVQLGKPFKVSGGNTITIDRISGSEESILLVKLESGPPPQ